MPPFRLDRVDRIGGGGGGGGKGGGGKGGGGGSSYMYETAYFEICGVEAVHVELYVKCQKNLNENFINH